MEGVDCQNGETNGGLNGETNGEANGETDGEADEQIPPLVDETNSRYLKKEVEITDLLQKNCFKMNY